MPKSARILCIFLLALAGSVRAQQTQVPSFYGIITDASTGEPLSGAVISVDFKKSGVVSGADGKYQLYLPFGEYILKISHVGYNPVRVRMALKRDTEYNVALNDVTKQLEEVIVSSSATKKDIQTPSLGVTILSLKGIKKLPTMMTQLTKKLQKLAMLSFGKHMSGAPI